ncbi:MAG: twin-arginine translocase subunit TatB [Deltaproteobacteria bacterium HGW-Deltaproteobacteria-12]|jgi:Tat protein translocase TatB subunit|nr:MAG: twin-arginine translocase subunit TatB [Deltaproteobacteria bacterium HGW-Deltaproteobacteria-12]
MFGIGFQELIIIAIIALLIVGPKKLPDLAKTLGKGLSEFRKATDGISDDLKQTMQSDEKPKEDGLKDKLLLNKPDQEESKPVASDENTKKS